MKLLHLPWNYWIFALGQKGFVHPWQLSNWLVPAICPKVPCWDKLLSFSSRMSGHSLTGKAGTVWSSSGDAITHRAQETSLEEKTLTQTSLPSGEGSWLWTLDSDRCPWTIVSGNLHSEKSVREAFLLLEMPQGDGSSSWKIPALGWRDLAFARFHLQQPGPIQISDR